MSSSDSTTSKEAVFGKWDKNVWRSETVSRILASRSEIINLVPKKCNKRKKDVQVHKNLLCHYSPYYQGALKGSFAEATSKTIEVDLDEQCLELFVGWLYTGKLHVKDDFGGGLLLYIFADMTSTMALRRAIMTRLHEAAKSARNVPYLFTYPDVKLAWMALPDSSPLRRYIMDTYVHHWDYYIYDVDSANNHGEAPKAFFYNILRARGTGIKGPNSRLPCPCCRKPCSYHEHENREERMATCGKNNYDSSDDSDSSDED